MPYRTTGGWTTSGGLSTSGSATSGGASTAGTLHCVIIVVRLFVVGRVRWCDTLPGMQLMRRAVLLREDHAAWCERQGQQAQEQTHGT